MKSSKKKQSDINESDLKQEKVGSPFNDLIIIGGGAAGVFAAISAKRFHPNLRIVILEKSKNLLAKVRLSGGGRCNVTNACFDPKILALNYPRGKKELIGPFHQFQPKDMMEWLENHNAPLNVEAGARVFPKSNSSETIAQAFITNLAENQVEVLFEKCVDSIGKKGSFFSLSCSDCSTYESKALLLASGSSPSGHALAKNLGHSIVEPVPSLFSLTIQPFSLKEISGVAVEGVELSIPHSSFSSQGSLLITHSGFSGPAALKLSAFSARHLASKNYKECIAVNWLPSLSRDEIQNTLLSCKKRNPLSLLINENIFHLPKSLWKTLLKDLAQKQCKDLSSKDLQHISEILKKDLYFMNGRTQNKEEFVTCGGIFLPEVDFRTMESKICPNLFFAGEILDIDGITGGFNLQNAWTTAFITGKNIKPTD